MRTPDHGSSSASGDAAAHGLIIAVRSTGDKLPVRPSSTTRGIKEWARVIALHLEALYATSNETSESARKWQNYHLDMVLLAKVRLLEICTANGYFKYGQHGNR